MRKLAIATASGLALSLAACGSADDASTEAEPDTVEVAAEEAIGDVDAEPVDDAAALEDATAAAEAAAADIAATADNAEDVAARVDAAMAEVDEE